MVNNKRSLLRASVLACHHKYFLITKAETCTRCVTPGTLKRTSSKDRHRRGVVYHCYQKYFGYSPFHYSENVLTRALTEKARISSWKTSCCLGVRSETCSVLHRILPAREIRVPEEQQSPKEKRKKVGSLQKELRIALFPAFISLTEYFRTSVLPIKLR